jgi:hypothetical protein
MGSTEGTLAFKGSANIKAPAAGLYLIRADLKNLTYSHTPVASVSYAGLNDNWALTAMTATGETGVFTSPVTISSVSKDGCQLVLNGDWATYYGGDKGVLKYKGQNIKSDAVAGVGSYDLVADVRDTTFALLADKVYIGGLNDKWDFTSLVLSKTSAGVYEGTATISAASKDGIRIYLYKDNWDYYFGGTNITDDKSLAAGTYNVTVDFIKGTCSFEVK